jgi:hypothetical protein
MTTSILPTTGRSPALTFVGRVLSKSPSPTDSAMDSCRVAEQEQRTGAGERAPALKAPSLRDPATPNAAPRPKERSPTSQPPLPCPRTNSSSWWLCLKRSPTTRPSICITLWKMGCLSPRLRITRKPSPLHFLRPCSPISSHHPGSPPPPISYALRGLCTHIGVSDLSKLEVKGLYPQSMYVIFLSTFCRSHTSLARRDRYQERVVHLFPKERNQGCPQDSGLAHHFLR